MHHALTLRLGKRLPESNTAVRAGFLPLASLAFLLTAGPVAAAPHASTQGVTKGAAPEFTETYRVAKDNTLCENAAGTLSNGAGDYIFAGSTNQGPGAETRRALLAFDFGESPPADAVITAVRLDLRMSMAISGATDVTLHRVTTDWGEGTSNAAGEEGACIAATAGDATWTSAMDGSTMWTTPGGDFVSSASATTSVSGDGSYSWTGAGLVADVASWASDTNPNFGWLLMGNEASAGSAKRFNSRTHPSITFRPFLEVTFESNTYQVFADGFEDGTLNEWSSSVGGG